MEHQRGMSPALLGGALVSGVIFMACSDEPAASSGGATESSASSSSSATGGAGGAGGAGGIGGLGGSGGDGGAGGLGGSGGAGGGGGNGGAGGGKNAVWTQVPPPVLFGNDWLNAIWGFSSQDIWAGGDDGKIIHYNGTVWESVPSGVPTQQGRHLNAIWGSSPTDVWAGGYMDSMTHFNGTDWVYSPTVVGLAHFGLHGTSSSNIWTVGGYGVDGGSSRWDGAQWSPKTTFSTNALGVWGSAANDVWAVGLDGFMSHYDGQTWTKIPAVVSNRLDGVWGSSKSDVWAVGATTILHFNGSIWSEAVNDPSLALYAVWGTSKTDVFAGGLSLSTGDGIILHYDGAAWTPMAIPQVKASLQGLWGSAPGNVWAVGSSGTILHYN